MPKVFKFVCVGLVSVLIGVFSSSIYAKKGGNQGNQSSASKGYMMKETGYPGKGNNVFNSNKKSSKSIDKDSKVKFSDKDRETITKFYSTHPFTTTELPPGIAKNLERGKPLPPGIAKVFLPKDLSESLWLYRAYPDYDYLIAGKDILLVNKSDQIIVDILHNILH